MATQNPKTHFDGGEVEVLSTLPQRSIPYQASGTLQVVDIPKSVLRFAEENDMQTFQVNAQRFFGPLVGIKVDWTPPKGSEIFVGRLPRFMQEPELVPLFLQAGPIFQVRMLMDFSGTNRGYCFVNYFDPRQADLAIMTLHGHQIRPDHYLVAVKSVDNCRLVMRGMPMYKTEMEVLKELTHYFHGVEHVMREWVHPYVQPKGMVVVRFASHRAAAVARSDILANGFRLWGYNLSVDWAEPEQPPYDQYFDMPHLLRVDNVKYQISARTLTNIFNKASFTGVSHVIKRKSTAFIYFYTRGQAEAAKVVLDNFRLGGRLLSVKWCDPQSVLVPGNKPAKLNNSKKFATRAPPQLPAAPTPDLQLLNYVGTEMTMNQTSTFFDNGDVACSQQDTFNQVGYVRLQQSF